MSKSMRIALGAVVLGGGVAVVALAVGGAETPTAEAQGVAWQDLTVQEALGRAEEEGTRVLVKFDAEWCEYCRTLDEEVLSTAEGARLTEDLVAVSFDFDDEANRPVVERYVVLGLPMTLVLTPDGTQVGRIQGYHGREEWIAELREAKTAEDPVPGLRAAYEAAPDDPVATLRLGEALLVRGSPDEGQALLERVTWMGGDGSYEAGAEALFLLGRYHHRVRRDARTSRHLWRELAARYPDSGWAGGAWSWYAKAQAELGHHELGLRVLRDRALANPDSAAAVSQWADYVVTHDRVGDREPVLAALRRVIEDAEGDDREELEELAAQLRP